MQDLWMDKVLLGQIALRTVPLSCQYHSTNALYAYPA